MKKHKTSKVIKKKKTVKSVKSKKKADLFQESRNIADKMLEEAKSYELS